eukprot:5633782-Pleurochrysis_carterae.AAC.4
MAGVNSGADSPTPRASVAKLQMTNFVERVARGDEVLIRCVTGLHFILYSIERSASHLPV